MSQDDPRRELRLAVVLYGGVSLAVYLNGVCQELVRVVLATSADERHRRLAGPVGAVYRRAAGDGTVRVVVDVLTGSSAGGINAVLAASGLRHGTPIDTTGDLWATLADLGALTFADDDRPPRALLDGDRLLTGVHDALAELAAGRTAPAVEALDCYVTATDLGGVPDDVELGADRVVHERHYRAVFHFAYGEPGSTGGHRDDLGADLAAVQAFACRATAAHPVAFEPARFADALDRLGCADDIAGAERLTAAFRRVLRGADEMAPSRWFSDGGDMDNKPFSYTLEPLRRRRATVPVTRRLVFGDPSPERRSDPCLEAPGWLPHIVQAVGLGRQERIVDDIERIRDLNRSIGSYGQAVRTALSGLDPLDPALLDEASPSRSSGWRSTTMAELRVTPGGVGRLAYERRRIEFVRDDLARMLTRRLCDTPGAPTGSHLRAAIDHHLGIGGDLGAGFEADGALVHRDQLVRFDLAYRLRRLDLIDHVLSLVADGDPAVARWSAGVSSRAVAEARARLNVAFLDLWSLGRHLPGDPSAAAAERRAADRHDHRLVPLGTPPPPAEDPVATELDRLAALAAPWFAQTSLDARDTIRSPLLPVTLQGGLAAVWLRFDELDQLLVGRHDDVGGELAPIEIHRISPVDATRLLGEHSDAVHKLAGRTLANFGGFLAEPYRRNDLLWGRLDAAETLVSLVAAEAGHGDGSTLVDEAHEAVLDDALALGATPSPWQRDLLGALTGAGSDAAAPSAAEVRAAITRRAPDLRPSPPPPRAQLGRLVEGLAPVAARALVHRPTSAPTSTDATRVRLAGRLGEVVGRRLSGHLVRRRPLLARVMVAAALAALVTGALLGGLVRFGWALPWPAAVALAGGAVAALGVSTTCWVLGSAGLRALGVIAVLTLGVAAVTGAWPLAVGAVASVGFVVFLPLRWVESRAHSGIQRVDELF